MKFDFKRVTAASIVGTMLTFLLLFLVFFGKFYYDICTLDRNGILCILWTLVIYFVLLVGGLSAVTIALSNTNLKHKWLWGILIFIIVFGAIGIYMGSFNQYFY